MVLEKKKQLKASQNNGNNKMSLEVDRISELSDPLLLHILSFLPTKCAISTSILAKRWEHLWTSIPILDFRLWRSPTAIDHPLETERFMNFVDRVLLLHKLPNIQKFSLNFDKHFDESRVNAWITTVILRNVEELGLFMGIGESFMFPLCLFTCESLTVLELEMDNDCDLNLPQSISFPKLKTLRLTSISFVDENLTQQLFSNCPVLEELSLTNCSWMDMKFVCISSSSMKRLLFIHPNSAGINTSVVKIYGPNLLSLQYNEIVAEDYVLDSFPLLVDADIDYIDENYHLQLSEASTKLLEKLSNVKLLKLSGKTFEVLSDAIVPLTNLPTFCNLTHLEVSSGFHFAAVRTLFDFLQISPNLESPIFSQGCYNDDLDDDDGWTLNLVHKSLLLHLKLVEFRQFAGRSEELKLVKLILTKARVLQRMTVLSASALHRNCEKETEVTKQLLMFPRASTNCVVSFLST